MSERILRLPEVRNRVGMSGTTIWRREKEGRFPRRRKLGPGAVGWKESDVEAWLADLPVAGVE